jgi:short-subunit dehydrogenase
MNLENKTVLVTGATGGIGSVIAEKLAAASTHLILLGRDQGKLTDLGKKLQAATYVCDLTDRNSRQETLNTITSTHKTIDILVHAAGIGVYKPLPDITQADWDTSFALNVEAPFFVTQACEPLMEKSHESLVLTIGSGAGVIPMRGRSLYCATKFALRGLMLSLADEAGTTFPRYCLITLGSTLTAFGPLSLDKKVEESLNGKAYFTPEWVADKLVEIMQDDKRDTEITLYPGDYGLGTWTKP